jgi:hypothetical protein
LRYERINLVKTTILAGWVGVVAVAVFTSAARAAGRIVDSAPVSVLEDQDAPPGLAAVLKK